MPRYIDTEKLYEFRKANIETNGYAANYVFGWNDAISKIENEAPTVDAAPVIHAHWIEQFEGTYLRRAMYCSACKKKSGIGGSKANQMKPYCPNCGARMDEKENEK